MGIFLGQFVAPMSHILLILFSSCGLNEILSFISFIGVMCFKI